ncbi:hypothetical protein DFH28DRAFT_905892 [Melampsora americana]|nr:hypothetical protein DFH28DRAFT_905892 [Melampsora americana]
MNHEHSAPTEQVVPVPKGDVDASSYGDHRNAPDDDAFYFEEEGFFHSYFIRPLFNFLALIAPSTFSSFIPMPSSQVPNYNLTPINPYRRVPLPPLSAGTETGLLCKSKTCKGRPTHSTVYFASTHKHLTGVKCPIDKDFLQTYTSKHFYDQIRALNRRVIDTAVTTINNSHREVMDLTRMLNAPPTPPSTQQASGGDISRPAINSRKGAAPNECIGVNRQTTLGHNPRNNAKCPAQACKACCLKLYKGEPPCSKHPAMARRQDKEVREHGRVLIIPSETNENVIDLISSSIGEEPITPSTSQSGRSMGVQRYQGRLKTAFLDEFRYLTLQKEAAERRRNVSVDNASKTIALVVWHGIDESLFASESWGGMVHASSWPQFALGESKDIKNMVAEELGTEWSGNLQIWNDKNQLWLHTAMDISVTYPANTRKILVVFPAIKPSECHEVTRHLASVSAGGRKDSMNLTAFIQRNTPATPQKNKNIKGHTVYLRSPSVSDISQLAGGRSSSPPPSSSAGNDHLPHIHHTIEETPPQPTGSGQPNPKKRFRSPSIESSDIEEINIRNERREGPPVSSSRKSSVWSKMATMRELHQVYQLTQDGPNKFQLEEAFHSVFGNKYRFVPSTISRYCRWCEKIRLQSSDKQSLDRFVDQHGDMKVESARKHHFNVLWRSTDATRFEQHVPPKRVKF